MSYLVFLLFICFVVGLVLVVSHPSPYYGAAVLVFVALVGSGLLLVFGSSFLSLVLLLVYLGGMLVVFAYSVALASDPYPEAWWNISVGLYFTMYFTLIGLLSVILCGLWNKVGLGVAGGGTREICLIRTDFIGVSLLYSNGAGALLVIGWALLLTLFVVLELVRGGTSGSIRSV
uniref:NADH-ubiquinone oxidoreductase chain 6 n=1 Tax=Heloderma suspectum TaxID=8554 RepID=A1IGK6_HELSU|nr:NADH dehydrogenase subunit 6 [Heloderma suspectum]BAF44016.1 NADH dehydrogenase subunit 6 [Heloderma suspectum]